MRYRPEIDGLRAVAVLPVILFHAGFELFSGGFVGVDVFFVISGYLITSIILDDLEKGTFSLAHFYERRARRILPALFLIMLVSVVLAFVWLMPRAMEDFAQSLVAVTTFSSNILFWLRSDYFGTAAELRPLLHTWSLAVEEQYYILFPLFLLLTWQYGKRTILAILTGLFVLSLGAAHWGAYYEPVATFYLLITRGWELLIGVFVAFFLRRDEFAPCLYSSFAAGTAGLALVLFSIFAFDPETPFPSLYTLIPTLGTALIILFAVPGTLINRVLKTKVLVGIGLISYSAYLWHQPLFAFAKYRTSTEPSEYLIGFLCLSTLPLAYLSWRYVEVPFRRQEQVSLRRLTQAFSSAAIAFISIGMAGHATNGFPDLLIKRYDEPVRSVARQFSDAHLYVPRRWNKELELRDFDDNASTLDVLIIGDSFAQDIANAIYESGLSKKIYLSGYHISRSCGNVWTDEDLSAHIDIDHAETCSNHPRYSHPKLQQLITRADEIWLVSSWRDWHITHLPETVERIVGSTDAKLRVFGGKGFEGPVSFYRYRDVTRDGSLPYAVMIDEQRIHTDAIIRSAISSGSFVDLFKILCPTAPTCQNTTNSGLVISFDGGHLTKEGAAFLGSRLEESFLLGKPTS